MVEKGAFTHPALVYRGDSEYLAGTVPYLCDGLAAGDRLCVAAPASRLKLLCEELGRLAAQVQMVDLTVAGRNPGWIIPGVLKSFTDAWPAGRARILSELVWPGRSREEYPACVLHEALVNLAFADHPVSILCPYDAENLAPEIIADAAVTHPAVIDALGERASPVYAPEQIVRVVNQPLPRPATAPTLSFDVTNYPAVRAFATVHALRLGTSRSELTELEMAVGELTANSLRHGGGSGTFAIWGSVDHVICEVSDGGHLRDPLAGRRPVPHDSEGGRGLLLANQIADLVRIHSAPDGTTVRLYFDRRSTSD